MRVISLPLLAAFMLAAAAEQCFADNLMRGVLSMGVCGGSIGVPMVQADSGMKTSGSVPERAEISADMKWKLEDIYPTVDAWEEAYSALEPKIDALSSFAGRLAEGPSVMAEYLKASEEAVLELEKLYVYANMKSHEDLRETRPMELVGRAESLLVKYGTVTAFFSPEVMELPEADINRWISEEPELKIYAFMFEQMLRARPHTLSKTEEELLARTQEISSVPDNAFSLLTNADLKFPDITDENGQKTELSEERWGRFRQSRNRDVRKEAFFGLHNTYDSFKNSIGALYAGSVKGDIFYTKVRGYKDSLARALFGDNVPNSVYDNVVGTAERFAPLMHRLVKLRKKALGLDSVHYYDLSAPMSDEVMREISYEDACRMAEEALAPLGADYIENFRKALKAGWIDVCENRGKRKGAYSWGSYGTHPYVLLNWNGTLNDVFTLVHEMGHAMHSFYSHANQPQVYGDYPILLAEVASTTNEQLLLGYLIKNSRSEEERKWLLDYYYTMVRTTFYRQAMFADFERRTHTFAENGGVLTPEWMGSLWRELNESYHGPDMTVDDALCVEWARIPHFYTAFYVYKYVTGFTAANAFASAMLNGEDGAVERYLTFLKSGGSAWPLDILRKAGVDLASPEPFERTMKLFEERLDEGEKLW